MPVHTPPKGQKNRTHDWEHEFKHNNKGSFADASWQEQSQGTNYRSEVHQVITWESKTSTPYRCPAADEDFGNSWGARTRSYIWLTNWYQWAIGKKRAEAAPYRERMDRLAFRAWGSAAGYGNKKLLLSFTLPCHASVIRFRMSRIFISRFWPSFRSSWRSCSNLLAKNKRHCSAREKRILSTHCTILARMARSCGGGRLSSTFSSSFER